MRLGLRSVALAVGAGCLAGAGLVLGQWWWLPAGAGIAATVGAWFDYRMGYLVVLATLGVVVGAVAEDQPALIVVLTVGFVAAIELYAVADRISIVRPQVQVAPPVVGATAVAALVSAGVVAVGEVDWNRPIGAVIVATLAAGIALRSLVR